MIASETEYRNTEIGDIKASLPSIGQRITRYVCDHLNLWAIGVLAISFLVLLTGRWFFGNPKMLPWLMFIPLLVGISFLPKARSNRLPVCFIFLAICLCVAALLDLTGILRGRVVSEPIYITRLAEDPTGGISRRLMQSLMRGGVDVGIVQRDFLDVQEVLDWMAVRPPTQMVLLAGAEWANLVVRMESPETVIKLPEWWLSEAQALGIDVGRDGIVLPNAFGSDPLWLLSSVTSVQVPLSPPESLGQYLSALDGGLNAWRRGEDPIEFFRQALLFDIAWRSSTPQAYAAFLAGTTQLAMSTDEAEVSCAQSLLRYAGARLKSSRNRKLSLAIQHNRLIAAIRRERNPARMLQTARSLGMLSRARLPDGSVPLAARAALLNLRTLDRALNPRVAIERRRAGG